MGGEWRSLDPEEYRELLALLQELRQWWANYAMYAENSKEENAAHHFHDRLDDAIKILVSR